MIAALEHFAPHHRELRQRLIRCFLAMGVTTVIAYLFIDELAGFCMQPLFHAYPDLQRLVYTKLTEAFISYLKLSFMVGLLFSSPVILYQLWMFVAPGLLDHERRIARQVIIWATMLFVAGGLFAYFVVLPRTLIFFMSYAGDNLQPMPKLGLYLTFVARMVMAFGIAFEIPFLMVMADRTGLVPRQHFKAKRKYFYLAIVVLSFLLTAGDPTATVLLAFPLFGLYEAGIMAGRVFGKNRKTKK
ncbi:sec-independent protein translocase protein TatC [Desulfolithobacter dissulfuricans]|uniref:Sec-independent protein translocase protein TatC n=1 Tax=Desulfolithobacter dissulfuricans TaxID=2795293 RepID=A0A915UA42_9BACT|nr:twin-arginine translocase subunit TatC [Desulfolithobacter dissulfuricans]BCO09591.1 sec-independent protein translocase protein TatC [Desulfolithobacter dissulfuricans]